MIQTDFASGMDGCVSPVSPSSSPRRIEVTLRFQRTDRARFHRGSPMEMLGQVYEKGERAEGRKEVYVFYSLPFCSRRRTEPAPAEVCMIPYASKDA